MSATRWLIGLLVGVGVLLLLWPLLTGGPTAPVPKEDPVVRLNRERGGVQPNAADVYREAFAALVGKEPEDQGAPQGPLTLEMQAYVDANARALELTLEASAINGCWFPLGWNKKAGTVDSGDGTALRKVARLLSWRARQAAADRDLPTFTQMIVAIDTLGRHAETGPCLIQALVANAIIALGQQQVLAPLDWPELTAAQRAAYFRDVAGCVEPPRGLKSIFDEELEFAVWNYRERSSIGMLLLAPPARVAGEFQQRLQPCLALAEKPVELQCDPANPLWVAIQAAENQRPGRFNAAGILAWALIPPFSRVLDVRARIITEQRGHATVLAVFKLKDDTGHWPATLDAVPGDFKIDPFSGQPFVYKLTDDGFTLYSLGIDRDDDGGRHDKRFGEPRDPEKAAPDGDFVFWPVPDAPPFEPLRTPPAASRPTTQP